MYKKAWNSFIILFINYNMIFMVDCYKIDKFIANLAVDAVNNLFFPSAGVTALLCAKTDNVIEFSKILSNNHVLSNYPRLENFENYINKLSPHKNIIFLDYNCPDALKVLHKANSSGMFSAPLKWLIMHNLNDDTSFNTCSSECLIKKLSELAIYPDSEVIIIRILSKEKVEISSVYRPSPVRDLVVEDRGFWRNKDIKRIHLHDTYVSSRRRKNLQQTPLKSSLVITNPDTLNHLTDYHDTHIDTITKCNYVWLNDIVDVINATVTYSIVDSWGYRDKNGSWNGMMGLLSRKEIDIGGTSMFLVEDRWQAAHYIPLSTPTRAAFIFRQPPLSFVSNIFTLPFRPSVWIATAILLSTIFVLLVITTKWQWSTRDREVDNVNYPKPTLNDNLMLVISIVAQQGFGRNLHTVSSRIVLLMLLVAVLNLYASYSANIVALLQSTTTSIRNLKDLLESPITCGAQDIVYNHHYFEMERDPTRRRMIEQKIEPKGGRSQWMSAEDGIDKVRQGFFAFFMETGPGYKIIQETFEEDEKCGFREIYFVEHFDPTFTIIKQSPYKEIIRVRIKDFLIMSINLFSMRFGLGSSLKIEESGLKSRESQLYYTKRPQCTGPSKFINVGLTDCYFAFHIVCYGVLFAVFVLLIELMWIRVVSMRRERLLLS